MNKYQKVINQMTKDGMIYGLRPSFRRERMEMRATIKEFNYNFEDLIGQKRFNKEMHAIIARHSKKILGR